MSRARQNVGACSKIVKGDRSIGTARGQQFAIGRQRQRVDVPVIIRMLLSVEEPEFPVRCDIPDGRQAVACLGHQQLAVRSKKYRMRDGLSNMHLGWLELE